jgi:hypothetical protein
VTIGILEFWDSGILEFKKKRVLPADHADWRGLKRIPEFWNSGIQKVSTTGELFC